MSAARFVLVVGTAHDREGPCAARVRAYVGRVHGPDARLEVVAVADDPELATRLRVIATPLLVRDLPLPQRRVVGVPEHLQQLAEALGEHLPPNDPNTPDDPRHDALPPRHEGRA